MAQYGLQDSISTITGKPQPSFDEKTKVAKGVGSFIKDYTKGLYYNLNPKAGPEMVYESILMSQALKGLSSDFREAAYTSGQYGKWAKELGDYYETAGSPKLAKLFRGKKGIDAVERMHKNTYKDIAQGTQKIPQELLDPVDDIFLMNKEAASGPGGSYYPPGHTKEYKISLNPLTAEYTSPFHEVNHSQHYYWGSLNRLNEWDKLAKPEQIRSLRGRLVLDLSQEFRKAAANEGVAYQGSKHYWENVIEQDSRNMEKWFNNFTEKNGRGPTAKEYYTKFDKNQRAILKGVKEKKPELWNTVVKKRIRLLKDQAGIKVNDKEFLSNSLPDSASPKISTDLPEQFSNTQEAVEFGTSAKPSQINKLTKYHKRSQKLMETHKANKDYQSWMDEATRSQFYREALEAFQGKHPSQKKGK